MTAKEILERLNSKESFQKLTAYLEQNFEDFGQVQSRYLEALEQLKKEPEKEGGPSAAELVDTIETQISSALFFSWILGIKANLEHFKDPSAPTVLDMDFEDYLCEDTACQLPEYQNALKIRKRFFAALTSRHEELLWDIVEYISYLETMAPKLAHFHGFQAGDELLSKLVPGYRADSVLTRQYEAMLEAYWG